jgi:hypothetical protein
LLFVVRDHNSRLLSYIADHVESEQTFWILIARGSTSSEFTQLSVEEFEEERVLMVVVGKVRMGKEASFLSELGLE